MPLLSIKNLSIEFPGRYETDYAVEDVSFDLEPGEILGLVGESGAGKSTIGNGIVQLLSPPGRVSKGDIYLNDTKISTFTDKEILKVRGSRVGFIFQDPMTSLNPLFTVENQLVETITTNLGVGPKEASRIAVDLLDQVGIPDSEVRIKQFPHQFSGGMRQRVVIAIALAGEPELLIADEPTTALDVSVQDQILSLIRKLCHERKVGCLLVTHDMGVIASVTDRVAVMFMGRLVEIGTTKQVLTQPQHDYTKSLISAVPRANIKIDRFPLVEYIETTEKGLKHIDVSNHWLGQGLRHAHSDTLLEIEDLNLSFITQDALLPKNRKYLQATKDVNLVIKAGESFGLVGESGSGKSTIARMVAGLQQPDSGSIRFDGVELVDNPDRDAVRRARRQMQMVFQNPYSSLNGRMKVNDIIAEPMRFHKLAPPQDVLQIVGDLLDHVGLGRQMGRRYPHEFSGGQRQRISIARALASRPRLLICDEPTSALDVSVQAQILNLLKDLQDELGLTMLFISHDLPVIRQMCDRVAIMRHGRILETAETEPFFEHPQNEYSIELLDLMPRFDRIYENEAVTRPGQ
ncbi:MAG: dipeptide ABC transporter ATP-binding protein [Gammaproteobacteria bacterium]|jgi:peptide/nickel transport system ATP-binding protein|nr:dipeptide ABC transporter ATP-binding protein [Gammaproteobacteria bacterium]